MSRRRAARSGVLVLIAGFLLTSGVLRVGTEASQVLAQSPDVEADPPPPESIARTEVAAIIAALDEREARLERRELQIADRMQALTVAEAEIERRLAELRAAEGELAATIAQVESAAETDLENLVTVYENMRPADAAALFETMAPEFAAGFIGRMRPDAAAEILTGLDPNIAYSISAILAGRNANAPRN